MSHKLHMQYTTTINSSSSKAETRKETQTTYAVYHYNQFKIKQGRNKVIVSCNVTSCNFQDFFSNMKMLTAILSLLIIESTSADYVQPSCAAKSRIFIATEGHVLNGHVISTHNVNLIPECHELCLQTPLCLSYNYEYKSTSSSQVCEINDATERMCPGSLARKQGFKYYEEKDPMYTGPCPPSADDAGRNFQLSFPAKSVKYYVRFDLQRRASPLTAFTLCLWLKVADQDPQDRNTAIFSYSIPNQFNEILSYDYTNVRLYIADENRITNTAPNNDGHWHHICANWENVAGSWDLYIDGAHLANGDNLKKGHVIDNNGIFILGQEQDNYGGGFQQYQSFLGQMSGVNMWNRVLTADEILHMSTNCSYGIGNYLRWSDFVTGLHGGVSMTSPMTCFP
ncbi:Neuronal pentraxin-1 [Desmophyllum pertusum]|uniref:Neuronal pentraxin-1 n=1 Tax=Desmophyllum pertusum TaxID=174260 RepID=A0A9W9YDH0_9CNID|nr:Neuronal pentraxin-1 [Desmophyllum pertusum]